MSSPCFTGYCTTNTFLSVRASTNEQPAVTSLKHLDTYADEVKDRESMRTDPDVNEVRVCDPVAKPVTGFDGNEVT